MALGASYRHVPNKHELLRLVAAELYASVEQADGSDGDKFEQAKRVMIQVHDVLAAYPGMAAHIAQNVPEFTSARVASLITGPLRAGGLSQGEASTGSRSRSSSSTRATCCSMCQALLEDVAGMQAVLADTGLQVTEIEFLGGWALDGDPAELEELVRRIEAVADAFGGSHVSAGERPATSRTLAMNCGSVLSFQVPATCGFSPKARQIRETDDCDRPVSPAIVQVDQCVSCRGLSRSGRG